MIRAEKIGLMPCPACGKKPIIVNHPWCRGNYYKLIACPDYLTSSHLTVSLNLRYFKHAKESLYFAWNFECMAQQPNMEPSLTVKNPSGWRNGKFNNPRGYGK